MKPEKATREEVLGVLAGQLMQEYSLTGCEQFEVFAMNDRTGQKMMVVVTVSDRATEMLQEFLDHQKEMGAVQITERTDLTL